ncbi:hypothetical protein A3715_09870 [Oleiphilus sp. HI0009]|uniref:GNAT family N-acetyltransferase n=1 Tax=Oleiphilus sp. HI0125 TaxID=1822266 RepID=UPI0007C2CA5D|nr:GNAT family N-acetyltransferase [Oleiphilus sp. HI0125]KZX75967.1 hypothetical protein A3715_22270 [Oleiphilus sp. HI0009]KZX78714.1 hypothetical protein A3715_09870 [Oleiphilus sp. HI0009]KZZ55381.1 hypothetical protein A3762_21760 [Oleiphilus sp. HI0125]KZZ56149.1 hypothetical protein A3762_11485 [Oleiphilus sp. HI0125]
MFSIDAINHADWSRIMDIQHKAYADDYPESVDVLKAKWLLAPETCLAIRNDEDLLGYCLAHPWPINDTPKLHVELNALPETDDLFIHDLALHPDARGQGAAKELVLSVLNIARLNHYKQVHLVAVQGSEQFWCSFGFEILAESQISAGYGDEALYMSVHLK